MVHSSNVSIDFAPAIPRYYPFVRSRLTVVSALQLLKSRTLCFHVNVNAATCIVCHFCIVPRGLRSILNTRVHGLLTRVFRMTRKTARVKRKTCLDVCLVRNTEEETQVFRSERRLRLVNARLCAVYVYRVLFMHCLFFHFLLYSFASAWEIVTWLRFYVHVLRLLFCVAIRYNKRFTMFWYLSVTITAAAIWNLPTISKLLIGLR